MRFAVKTLRWLTMLGPIWLMLPSGQVSAQVMIDMSRVTCGQYLAMPPDQARVLSAWMSGYFNQKSGYAWVDLNAYAKNVASMTQWCKSYPGETVMTGLKWATGKQ
jgi:HdeA/HdeB family